MPKQTETGEFTDPRDGKTYKTVKIGEQVWFAENLNWEGAGVCYNDDPDNGVKYGRLYTWNEALVAAPPGWHLPTDDEWQKLVDFAGGNDVAGNKLRAKDGWDGNGTDDFGFLAFPGGYLGRVGGFARVGRLGGWWSTTKRDSETAYYWRMDSGDASFCRYDYYDDGSYSVRLAQD